MELWSKVQTICPDIKFQIVPFENTPENAREILADLGTNIDVVGGIFDETMLHLRKCAGLELVRRPFYCAVSIHHKLAAKDRLQITDLYGENLLLMHRGWSHYVDELRDDLWQHHPQVNIVDFEFYSMDIFNRCENTNDVLLAIPGWANVHPLLKVIPVDWDYGIPYGILHSPNPTPAVQRTLRMGSGGEDVRTLQSTLKQLGFLNGAADGKFGAATREAVKRFQQSAGLSADGVVGAATWAALPKADEEPSVPTCISLTGDGMRALIQALEKPQTEENRLLFTLSALDYGEIMRQIRLET